MPAIQIARLRAQVDQLIALYAQPVLFLKGLHDLLEFYDDRTYRAGEVGHIQSLLPHYKVHKPILRQIEIELARLVTLDPENGLKLADSLWSDSYIEPRLLAIHLLGCYPVTPPDQVVERISKWAQPGEDRQVLNALIHHGTYRLLREQPTRWSSLVQEWLTSEDMASQSMGLYALRVTVEDESFQNLPVIFHLISPFAQNLPTSLQVDLLSLFEALAKRSPSETAYFFRQVLILAPTRLFPRLVRRCLPSFDLELQTSLRQALKTLE